MIYEVNQQQIPYILSNAAQKAYEKVKSIILKIFSLIKENLKQKNLKEEFYQSYIDFARKLKEEGHDEECYLYMSICEMYYRLIDRTDDLICHEDFFTELFDEFDDLLLIKINDSDEYEEKLIEFNLDFRKKRRYYYTQVARPSKHYNESVLEEISSNLIRL